MKKHQAAHSASLPTEQITEQHKRISTESHQQMSVTAQNFFYPDSTVLKNKHGIKEANVLRQQCARDVEQAMEKLRNTPPPEKIDSLYLREIHKCLFSKTFEWAGHIRGEHFQFADGSVAFAPHMKRKEFRTPFASSKTVKEGLENLDQALAETNYLKDLSREEFVEHAAGLMINLHHLHPFREGNRRTQRVFFEKLAESAGHKLDFSLVTKRRKMFVSVAAIDNGDPEPMKHLLEDISNPEKLCVLNEFTNEMRELGLDEKNYPLTVAARDGQTYNGTYRGSGSNGFMIDVKGTCVVGNKQHLPPELLKTLKIGDRISFTAPKDQDWQKILIPSEKVAPLTENELSERVQNHISVQKSRKRIKDLCKVVYGNSNILQSKMPTIEIPMTNENIAEMEIFARQVGNFPSSFGRLRGVNVCGIQSGARQHAKENILPLSHAILDYLHTSKMVEKDILESHHMEQKRCEKSIEIPSEQIRNLFSLSKEQQKVALSTSRELRTEITTYTSAIHKRLSSSEHTAIKENSPERLAKNIGTSVNQAAEIIKIVTKGKELEENLKTMDFTLDKLEERSTQNRHQSVTKNMSKEEASKTLSPSAIQAKKVETKIETFKATEQSVQQHKAKSLPGGLENSAPSAIQAKKVETKIETFKATEQSVQQHKAKSLPGGLENSAPSAIQAKKVVTKIESFKATEQSAQQHKAKSLPGGLENSAPSAIQAKKVVTKIKTFKATEQSAQQHKAKSLPEGLENSSLSAIQATKVVTNVESFKATEQQVQRCKGVRIKAMTI
ncbi:BID domain-containing T4SS effector [Bartonella raoultii]|uniref:BID domain-containing T4SS effector n=1 Tax=Bartonella raoultii TaxID=1457020 RepID=UPI001ABBAF09|nr:BID domain-containing T4SS effector [Bartonella raoultii]